MSHPDDFGPNDLDGELKVLAIVLALFVAAIGSIGLFFYFIWKLFTWLI